jgi:hypothetical protein
MSSAPRDTSDSASVEEKFTDALGKHLLKIKQAHENTVSWAKAIGQAQGKGTLKSGGKIHVKDGETEREIGSQELRQYSATIWHALRQIPRMMRAEQDRIKAERKAKRGAPRDQAPVQFTGELVAFFKAVDLGSYNGKRLQDHADMKRFFENGIGKNTFGVSLFNVFGNVHKLRNNTNTVTLSAKERTLISGALDALRAKKVAEGKSVDVANLDAGQLQNKDYMSILSFYKNKTAKPEALAPFSADVMRMVELTGELNDKYRAELKEKRPKVKVVREKPTTPAKKSPKAAPAPAAKGKAATSKIAPVAAPAPAAKPSVASPGKGKAPAKR